jgi:ceramide glucosyltransferase
MYVFYFFAVVAIFLGVTSLRSGLRFAAYVRSHATQLFAAFTPFASVIAPSRGLDQGLRENIAALFQQDYPAYEIIFVVDKEDDPSLSVIEDVKRSYNKPDKVEVRILIAGEARDAGQKVYNLRAAVSEVSPLSQILAFVDTDALTGPNWLRSLVAPLHDTQLGATTGYRWFIPVKGDFASHLRSVWNASITSSLGGEQTRNFCWGGSTAISRKTFEDLQIRECWRGTVSDDFTITRILHKAGRPIHFVPTCLVASLDDCSFHELLEFTTRQLKITRVYAPHLWTPVLLGSLLFSLVFFGGILLVAVRAVAGLSYAVPLLLIFTIFLLGVAKALVRWRAIAIPLKRHCEEMRGGLPAQLVLWPLASALYLYNALAAMFSRRIQWRGITYELKSPSEAVIIARGS